MNKTLKYALGAVMSIGFVAGANAQNFPDVPDNHWAYEALANMKKEGLLMGYPDGLFRGNRPATRYEMAVAIYATYTHLKNITDSLDARIKALEGNAPDNGWKAAVEALRAEVNGMKGWGDSINDLKRMASTFEKELAAQGVDIEAMKKDLAALSARVDKLEKTKMPVEISGEVHLYMQAGSSTSNRPGVGVDGQAVGTQNGNSAPVGMTQDFSVFHEAALTLKGTNETGPKWWGTLLFSNALDSNLALHTGFPRAVGGHNVNDNSTGDLLVKNLVVEFDTAMLGQGFNAKVGRVGYQISPYIYKQPDMTAYYDGFVDDGNWIMDGGVFSFNFGSAKFNVFAGRNNNRNSINGIGVGNSMVGATAARTAAGVRPVGLGGGAFVVDQSLGLHLNVPLTEKGNLDLAYLFHEGNAYMGAPASNRAQVFGGELNWDAGAIKLNGGYSKSNLYAGKNSVVNKNNDQWHLNAGYESDRWGVMVGYKEIQPLFNPMGDWGRIGMWWNPTDIKGIDASVHFNMSEALTLKASGNFYQGIGKTGISGLGTEDKLNGYNLSADYKLAEGWNLMLGAEFVDWKLAAPGAVGSPRERWYNIGLGYALSDMAKLSVLWQISDYDSKGVGGFNPFLFGGNRATGNLLTTQLNIKF